MKPYATFGISVYSQQDGSAYTLGARYVTPALAQKMADRFEAASGGPCYGIQCAVVEFGPAADAAAAALAVQVLAESTQPAQAWSLVDDEVWF